MPHQYVLHFAQAHTDFRLSELESLAKLEGISLCVLKDSHSPDSPFLVIELESNEQAKKLIQRGILIKNICELWAAADNYNELFGQVSAQPGRLAQYKTCSFKFNVSAFGKSLTETEKIEKINQFSFTGFEGPIDLKAPEEEFMLHEDYEETDTPSPPKRCPRRIYFGRLIGRSQRHQLIKKYTLKQRKYVGNTSMDAELSLIMANQALARPGTLIYDPFVGTGSLLMTCAEFGSFTVGSDIDGRQIRGTSGFRKGVNGIKASIEQYELGHRVLDGLVFDICRHPWRAVGSRTADSGWFDAIVTDPPYGVRAGAKRLGRKDGLVPENSFRIINGVENYKRGNYYPPTVPYEMEDVIVDLLEFAAIHLTVGGRLVYWVPTVTEEYQLEDIPTHPAFELVANSEQQFGSWSRRLVTMKKIRPWTHKDKLEHQDRVSAPDRRGRHGTITVSKSPAHRNFRERYFEGFIPRQSAGAGDAQ
ncbi:hypothetical protein EV182_000894 [Spiromyces aspiralis]|uniref:Uncharacterized protein n=1 Tax=Spiromyces aspiralis TaxID=68401 RepID=A0ACC1HK61_9FUNG|nr:hypothetical protein EV182_000894 [Spiromyces aspiralis]